MLFKVVRALLSPWVRRQGQAVQRRAASLPEPAGNREGVSGTGKVCLRVLIVGDSSAAGVGAESQSQALSGRLGEALSQRLGGAVVWQVIARRGDNTAQSTEALRRLPLRPADVMVTTLGLTDMIAQVSTRRWLEQLDELDRAAARLAGVQHIVHCGMPPVHSFALPNPLRWVLVHGQRRYNQALAEWCERQPDMVAFTGAVIDARAFAKHEAAIERAKATAGLEIVAGGSVDDSVGWFVRPTVVVADDPTDEMFSTEYFGPILVVHVYDDRRPGAFEEVVRQAESAAPYALTGSVLATDRRVIDWASNELRFAAGNFYVNDKPTGAVVGQQPFGGGRASGTNDKAGSALNLLRWTSPRSIKETLVPPTEHRHPHMG